MPHRGRARPTPAGVTFLGAATASQELSRRYTANCSPSHDDAANCAASTGHALRMLCLLRLPTDADVYCGGLGRVNRDGPGCESAASGAVLGSDDGWTIGNGLGNDDGAVVIVMGTEAWFDGRGRPPENRPRWRELTLDEAFPRDA